MLSRAALKRRSIAGSAGGKAEHIYTYREFQSSSKFHLNNINKTDIQNNTKKFSKINLILTYRIYFVSFTRIGLQ